MPLAIDTVLDHLRETPDLLSAVLERELGQPVAIRGHGVAAAGDVPDVAGYGVGLWVVCGSTTIGLALPPEVVPVEWDGHMNAPPGLADRLAAGLLPESLSYRDPRLTDVVEVATAVVPETRSAALPAEGVESPLVLLWGLHNPAAVERIGDARLKDLPVDVVVTLAEKRIDVGQLLAITPGALIPFSKPCEDLLDLYVNNHLHARGEAVKIGEKFGLKISRIGVDDERVSPVLPPAA